MRVPVLTYHAANVSGNNYAENDHVAFAADLALIEDLGLRIVPLRRVVDNLIGRANHDLAGCVAVACDDGTDFDYFDLEHPQYGRQRSLFNSLLDFRRDRGRDAQPALHLTAFVIASPDARRQIDIDRLGGQNRMRGTWWRPAQSSGLVSIENHSWDHNHPALVEAGFDDMPRGSFLAVNNEMRADAEIAQASYYLNARLAPHRVSLFCYPFGHVNDYLHLEYLPERVAEHGIQAAFSDGAEPIHEGSDRWLLPRYICGWHWTSPGQLERILRDETSDSS
ncbi:MAG: polysaccharide deacetylase family protein [Rhodanobacteraceae bacterium]